MGVGVGDGVGVEVAVTLGDVPGTGFDSVTAQPVIVTASNKAIVRIAFRFKFFIVFLLSK